MIYQTGFSGIAPYDIIINSDSTSGYVCNLPISWGMRVPTNAVVRNVWMLITDAYQYSTHRYAKVVDTTFNLDMCDPFTTDGSSSGSDVNNGFQINMYNQRQSFQVVTSINIRIRGAGHDAGYSDGAVFRILSGSNIDIFLNWEPGVQSWRNVSGVWHQTIGWRKFNGVWYETMTRRNVGGIWK